MSTDKTKTHYTFKITKDGKQYQLKVNPEKLNQFNDKSVNGGKAICMKQSWNTECHTKYKTIDRLSDIIGLV